MSPGRLSHNLLVYDTDADFAAVALPYLAGGVGDGQAVLAVLPRAKWDLLSDLGPDADAIELTDSDGFYSRPETALATYDATVRRMLRDGAASVRAIGEFPVFETVAEQGAFAAYDAVVNHAFARRPVELLCAYDARAHPASVIDAARRSHPQLMSPDGMLAGNIAFEDPAALVRRLTPAPVAEVALTPLAVTGGGGAARERLAAELERAGVRGVRALDVMLAATEVLDNAERHGRGVRALGAGMVGDEFVVEVSDHGPGIDDPTAGFVPPDLQGPVQSGLWAARQLTGRLEILHDDAGATVRLWV